MQETHFFDTILKVGWVTQQTKKSKLIKKNANMIKTIRTFKNYLRNASKIRVANRPCYQCSP